ncbi:glycoside hydrolase, partial [Aspergillus ellipticus CBS 707.79]
DGTIWQWDYWQAGMAIIDFTNPSARAWFRTHLQRLQSLGIDSFKTDFGERIPHKNVVYHDPTVSPQRMHNYYTLLFNQLVYTTLHPSSLLFARSATTGSQKYPVHWSGDCESTFPALAENLRGGLSLSLCGFIFWASDIGGFEGTPPPAVYKRWVQFGLLCTHSRLHGSGSYRVPWLYGEDCVAVLRECVKRKIALTPYLLAAGLEGGRTGTPVMRPLLLEFPADENVWGVDREFMLGGGVLVAPVLGEGGQVRFYVPLGKWVSWFDHGKTYEGGRWYTETHGFDTLPLLIRPGAVIPLNWKLDRPEGDPLDGLEVLVNGPVEGEVKVEVVDPERPGEVLKVVTVRQEGGVVVADEGVKVVWIQ